MAIPRWLQRILDHHGVTFEERHHPPAHSASELAQAEHVSGYRVIKTVFLAASGRPVMRPVTEMQVKSAIARPAFHEQVAAGKPYRVFGAAWASESHITKVEVSTDGGTTWQPAKLIDPPTPFTWQRWEYRWQVPAGANRYTLMSRATDSRGHVQPAKHDPDRRAYMINFTLPVEVIAS